MTTSSTPASSGSSATSGSGSGSSSSASAPQRNPGRPSHLTDERMEQIVADLRAGATIAEAAAHAGVGRRTLTTWLEKSVRRRKGDRNADYRTFGREARKARRAFLRAQAREQGPELYVELLARAVRTGELPTTADITRGDRQTRAWLRRYLQRMQHADTAPTPEDEATQLRRYLAGQDAQTRALLATVQSTPPLLPAPPAGHGSLALARALLEQGKLDEDEGSVQHWSKSKSNARAPALVEVEVTRKR